MTLRLQSADDFWLCINGICTPSDDADGWQYRAVEYFQQKFFAAAEAYMYYCWAITRFVRQPYHIRCAAEIFRRNEPAFGKKKVLMHSNGCEIGCKMMAGNSDLYADEFHLVAGACDADFNINGLNLAVSRGQIGKIVVYVSANDRALLAAEWSKRLVGWLGLGYGNLGRAGPRNMNIAAAKITTVIRDDANDHGDWLGKNFAATIQIVTAGGVA